MLLAIYKTSPHLSKTWACFSLCKNFILVLFGRIMIYCKKYLIKYIQAPKRKATHLMGCFSFLENIYIVAFCGIQCLFVLYSSTLSHIILLFLHGIQKNIVNLHNVFSFRSSLGFFKTSKEESNYHWVVFLQLKLKDL